MIFPKFLLLLAVLLVVNGENAYFTMKMFKGDACSGPAIQTSVHTVGQCQAKYLIANNGNKEFNGSEKKTMTLSGGVKTETWVSGNVNCNGPPDSTVEATIPATCTEAGSGFSAKHEFGYTMSVPNGMVTRGFQSMASCEQNTAPAYVASMAMGGCSLVSNSDGPGGSAGSARMSCNADKSYSQTKYKSSDCTGNYHMIATMAPAGCAAQEYSQSSVGTYRTNVNAFISFECLGFVECGEGTVMRETGCESCPAGTYRRKNREEPSNHHCDPCPQNQWSNAHASHCTQCPHGKSTGGKRGEAVCQ